MNPALNTDTWPPNLLPFRETVYLCQEVGIWTDLLRPWASIEHAITSTQYPTEVSVEWFKLVKRKINIIYKFIF